MVGIPTNGRYTDLSGSPGWKDTPTPRSGVGVAMEGIDELGL